MDEKLAIVVGASRGLGLEIARRFIEGGYRVLGTTSKSGSEKELAGNHGFPFAFLDLSNLEDMASTTRLIVREHGIPHVVVINGAIGNDKVMSTMHDSEITRTLTVNLTGSLLATKYLTRPMLISGTGSVVIVGSITAQTGYSGLAVYGAAKAGLVGAVRGLARELGKRGVRINIVHPGFMDTEMTQRMTPEDRGRIASRSPFKRFVSTSEVSEAVFFLGGELSRGISGTSLTVDLAATA